MENSTETSNRLAAAELINESCKTYKLTRDYGISIYYDGQDELVVENCSIEDVLESRKTWSERGSLVSHSSKIVEVANFQQAKGDRRETVLLVEFNGATYWKYSN